MRSQGCQRCASCTSYFALLGSTPSGTQRVSIFVAPVPARLPKPVAVASSLTPPKACFRPKTYRGSRAVDKVSTRAYHSRPKVLIGLNCFRKGGRISQLIANLDGRKPLGQQPKGMYYATASTVVQAGRLGRSRRRYRDYDHWLYLVGLDPEQHRRAHGRGTNQRGRDCCAHPLMCREIHAAARCGSEACRVPEDRFMATAGIYRSGWMGHYTRWQGAQFGSRDCVCRGARQDQNVIRGHVANWVRLSGEALALTLIRSSVTRRDRLASHALYPSGVSHQSNQTKTT